MLVIGFDTETTGLNTEQDHIIEIGAVLWDTERKTPLAMISELILPPGVEKLEPKIIELTGIEFTDLQHFGLHPAAALNGLNKLFAQGDAIVAHNGNLFDKPIYTSNCLRHGVEPAPAHWIDTTCDIPFPTDLATRKLKHLAAEHGFLNPFSHRALFDVLTMLKIAQEYDWAKILEYSKSPSVTVQIKLDFHQKRERELVKKLAYRWNDENKIWVKTIKDFQLEETKKAAADLGLKITVKP